MTTMSKHRTYQARTLRRSPPLLTRIIAWTLAIPTRMILRWGSH